jgi:hypothetical protein
MADDYEVFGGDYPLRDSTAARHCEPRRRPTTLRTPVTLQAASLGGHASAKRAGAEQIGAGAPAIHVNRQTGGFPPQARTMSIRRFHRVPTEVVAAPAIWAISAPSLVQAQVKAHAASATVTVAESEFKIKLSTRSAKPGMVTFKVTNNMSTTTSRSTARRPR